MKNALIFTTLLIAGLDAHAQLGPAQPRTARHGNTFTIQADNAYTQTNMHVKTGDTVFIKANGAINAGQNLKAFQGHAVGPEGYSDMISKWPGTSIYNKYPRTDQQLAHHAALVVLVADNKHEIMEGEEYNYLSPAKNKPGYMMYIANYEGDIILDLNDRKQQDNDGALTVALVLGAH